MMEYLAFFRASEELEQELKSFREGLVKGRKEEVYNFPSAGVHCTLFKAEAEEEDENSILNNLETIRKELGEEGLVATASELDLFAKNSLVLKLERTESLHKLHRGIFVSFLPYIIKGSAYMDRELLTYFGDNYSPHISLARFRAADYVPEEWQEERTKFSGREFQVRDFCLVKADKKAGEEWREVWREAEF
ncbi:MAG TPA: hypothetical protein HA250_01105 [Nanoarchaeota archaeon]|nr:hypothetical protein [Nanoarchaeota archaeon]HIH34106.1 hypothetical protein [Nanoarchaeota archaeon]HIH50937.1 hypothetical protein [Nanoarchaeota archaeon]